jgi:hypothetical protein
MSLRSEPPFEEPLEDHERVPDPNAEPSTEESHASERGQPDEAPRRGPAIEPDRGPDQERGL